MKTRAFWISRAREQYEVARNLSRVAHDPDLPELTGKVAESRCRSYVTAAERFEELALAIKEDAK